MTSDPDARAAVPEPPVTGVAPVDRVLAGLGRLEERPVAERVGVFEAAHTGLRAALDPGEDDGSDGDSEADWDDEPIRTDRTA